MTREKDTSTGAILVIISRGIETEVIGPLRIWHIIGISFAMVTSAVFMLCCCCNFRVPRTRQQIEENYLKRKMNKRYLRLLERNTEELLTRRGRWPRIKAIGKSKVSATDSSGNLNFLNSTSVVSHHPGSAGVTRSRDVESSVDAPLSPTSGPAGLHSLLRAPVGVQTPAPFRPRDILAMMAQQSRLSVQESRMSAQKPRMNAQQPRLSVQKPTLNVQQSRLSAPQPTLNVQKSRMSVQKPTLSVQQPTLSVQQPILSVPQPTLSVQQPTLSVQQPTLSVQQPTLSVPQPTLSVHQPRLSIDHDRDIL